MLQIVFNHLVGHLTNVDAKIPVRPKGSSPVLLFQMRKSFEKIARSPSFNSPHNFAGGHIRRGTNQNVDIILAPPPFRYSIWQTV
jgi:hypothetical protein